MKNLYLSLFLLLTFAFRSSAQPQIGFQNYFPEGIYLTKEDFISKTPSEQRNLITKSTLGINRKVLDSVESVCFFYYEDTDKRLTKPFAISHKGALYFQIAAILSNRNKADKSQTSNTPNAYSKVLMDGNNFLYTEVELANAWAQGTGYGIGGVAGGIMAANAIKGKGVVWDIQNSEFNIFKNCKDYNIFIADKLIGGTQNCKNNQPDMIAVREAIYKIK